MLGRRLMVLMAVLLGLTALATALAPRPRVAREGAATPQPAPTVVARPAVEPSQARIVERTLEADPARPAVVRARVGDTIRLVVRGQLLDSVEVEGLGAIEQVEPDSPARFELFADQRATHGIRLVDADKRIGRLEIG
jgi:hypothetical protein